MTDAVIRSDGRSGPVGISILRYGIPVVALISAILWGGWTHRNEVQVAIDRSAQNVALINQYTERLIQTQTILHRAAVERAQDEAPGFLRSEAFHHFLERLEKTGADSQGIGVVSFGGDVIASSRAYPVNAKLEGRAYVTAIAAGAAFFVDRLRRTDDKTEALVVATRFDVPGFSGLMVSGVKIGVIRDFLKGVAGAPDEAASLMRDDGMLLVRNVLSEPILLPPGAQIRSAIRKAEAGSFTTTAASDGIERIYSYCRIRDLPLYANFGTPTSAVTRLWLEKALPVWALLAAIGGFTFLISGQIQRSLAAQFEAEANQRRLSEAERLAEQRRQLMGEMNHRVKNNLALVAALISLQMRSKSGLDGAELKARVMAISEVHEFLYRTPDSEQMDFGEILTRICTSPAIIPKERNIDLKLDIAPGIVVEPDHATTLALSAAEILTNAVKHAFVGRPDGRISVTLLPHGEDAVMVISDDGVGLPKAPERSSGLRIVDGLVAQVGGTLERSVDGGTLVSIRFPLKKPQAEQESQGAT